MKNSPDIVISMVFLGINPDSPTTLGTLAQLNTKRDPSSDSLLILFNDLRDLTMCHVESTVRCPTYITQFSSLIFIRTPWIGTFVPPRMHGQRRIIVTSLRSDDIYFTQILVLSIPETRLSLCCVGMVFRR
ncbi:hypothetical protein B0H12DRAFT_55994 [Mycena haematopus]|nr:hypothetical protein B0H12DRAFT_55994 [Mycena haematopus]